MPVGLESHLFNLGDSTLALHPTGLQREYVVVGEDLGAHLDITDSTMAWPVGTELVMPSRKQRPGSVTLCFQVALACKSECWESVSEEFMDYLVCVA